MSVGRCDHACCMPPQGVQKLLDALTSLGQRTALDTAAADDGAAPASGADTLPYEVCASPAEPTCIGNLVRMNCVFTMPGGVHVNAVLFTDQGVPCSCS